MKQQITVKELREQLEAFERIGMGEAKVWYRDYIFDWIIEFGIMDTNENKVVLG